jgi:hypothetical protein
MLQTKMKNTLLSVLSVLVGFAFWISAAPQTASAQVGSWVPTGNLNTNRTSHSATLLPNGKVLVAGGTNNGAYLTSCELYDPATGTWSNTGSLSVARRFHYALLLSDGNVLVVGGLGPNLAEILSCELYDPLTGVWSAVGSLAISPQQVASVTFLTNGKVLATGVNKNSQLYDPITKSWTVAPNSLVYIGSYAMTSTLLPNNKVLVAGSAPAPANHSQLYDIASGTWALTSDFVPSRRLHTANLLPNGSVLAAGGYDWVGAAGGTITANAELYNYVTGTWTPTGSLTVARRSHFSVSLFNGKVMVIGGNIPAPLLFTSTCEVYDPQTGIWTSVVDLPVTTANYNDTATLLQNGKILATKGSNSYLFDTAATCNSILISQTTLPNATLAVPYSQTLSQTGIIVTPFWSISAGALPNGITLNASTGELSGVPASAGTFNFTVRANGGNCFGEQNYSLVINKGVTTVALAASPKAEGSNLNYVATVSRFNAAGALTGTVQFKKNGVALGAPITVSSGGKATLNLAAPASGIFTISAVYSGDVNYLTSTGSKQTAIYQHSIRDEATGKYLLFNSTAGLNGLVVGAWFYSTCPGANPFLQPATTNSGFGSVIISPLQSTIKLVVAFPTGNALATINTATLIGTVTANSPTPIIKDDNISNNTVLCN